MTTKRRCRECGEGELVTSDGPYSYKECGLSDVFLSGIQVRTCTKCGVVEAAIPRVTELHRALALSVVQNPTKLVGEEIRFLRKYLGLSGVDFAERMGVSHELVSRWENDKKSIGGQSDRLLRMMVVRDRPVEEYPIDELAKIEDDAKAHRVIGMVASPEGWAPAAMAC